MFYMYLQTKFLKGIVRDELIMYNVHLWHTYTVPAGTVKQMLSFSKHLPFLKFSTFTYMYMFPGGNRTFLEDF